MVEQLGILTDNKSFLFTSKGDIFQKIGLSEPQQRRIEKYNISITENGISWILKLVEKLQEEIGKASSLDKEYFSDIVEAQFKLLIFILEDSNYLSHFPNQACLREHFEQQLRVVSWSNEGLTLIQSNQDVAYIVEIARKLILSGYIADREHKIVVLSTLCLFSNNLLDTPVDDFIRVLYILSSIIPDIIPQPLSARIEKEKENLETLHYNTRNDKILNQAEGILRLLAARILLHKTNFPTIDQVIDRIKFYRHLYILSNYKHDILREKAFDILLHLNISSRIPFTWQNIIDFSLPDFIRDIISSLSITQQGDEKKRVFRGRGEIVLQDGQITCYPIGFPKSVLLNEIEFLNRHLVVTSSEITSEDINATFGYNWHTLTREYSNRPKERNSLQHKERPEVGTLVKIQIKNLHPTNKLFAFVRIVDDQYEGDGVLHVKEITRVILQTLEGIINPHDIMYAKVIESTPDRLSFEIMDELDALVGARFHDNEITHAKLLAKRNNLLTWISEDGYCLYSGPSTKFDPEIGTCYMLKLKEVNENGYIKAKILELAPEIDIDIHEAVGKLIYYHKESDQEYYIGEDGNFTEDNEPEYTLPTEVIKELEYIPLLYEESTSDILQKFNYLSLGLFLNTITQNSKFKEYYSILIDYYVTLHGFSEGKTIDNWFTNEMLDKFPGLADKRDTLLILSRYDSDNSELLQIIQQDLSPENKQLANLVLLYNLSKTLNKTEIISQARLDVLSLLSLIEKVENNSEEENISKIHFGREDNNREFKTSIVYSNRNGVANLDNQLEVIFRTVCGFLNAEGGTLFIGVNDEGTPIGIESDLQFMHCNIDTYQLTIRQYAVENLGKDINSLLCIDFRTYGNKTIAAISVPSYHKAVKFRNTVYQRQGNATRPLESTNIKL